MFLVSSLVTLLLLVPGPDFEEHSPGVWGPHVGGALSFGPEWLFLGAR